MAKSLLKGEWIYLKRKEIRSAFLLYMKDATYLCLSVYQEAFQPRRQADAVRPRQSSVGN